MRGLASTQRDRGVMSHATVPQSSPKPGQQKATVSRERLEKGRFMLASVNRKTKQIESGTEAFSVREQPPKQPIVTLTARSHRRSAPADLLGRELATHVAYTNMMAAFQEWHQLTHVALFQRSWVSYKTLKRLQEHAHRRKVRMIVWCLLATCREICNILITGTVRGNDLVGDCPTHVA